MLSRTLSHLHAGRCSAFISQRRSCGRPLREALLTTPLARAPGPSSSGDTLEPARRTIPLGQRRSNGRLAAAAPDAATVTGEGAGQQAQQQPANDASQHKGTVLGAVALLVGSTVGGGMLALPAVTAPAGLLPTSAGLIGIWALLTVDALLIAEVNLAALAARDSRTGGGGGSSGRIITLRQMAEFSLGKAGKGLTLVFLAMSYALLTAYCTKAAEVLDYFAGGGLPPLAGAALFSGAVGGMMYLGGTRTVDSINQGLTSVLLALFAFILTAGVAESALPGALQSGLAGLASVGPCNWGAVEPAVPIMFLALVYHDLIPVIVTYLGGDRSKIRSAIVLGSVVPLAMFLSWEAVALSILPAGINDVSGAGAGVLEASLHLPLASEGSSLAVMPAVLAGPGAAADFAGASAGAGATLAEVSRAAAAAGMDGPSAMQLAVDPLQVFVRRSGPVVGSVVEGFSFLAIFTSFIGTTLSLSETLRTEVPELLREAGKMVRRSAGADVSSDASVDELACLAGGGPVGVAGCSASWAEGAAEEELEQGFAGGDQRGLALLLTLCPPLVLAASNPDSFLGALEIAGGYFMTLLYGIVPPLMVWQLREKLRSKPGPTQQQDSTSADAAAGAATVGSPLPAGIAAAAVERLQLQGQGQPLDMQGGASHRPQQPQQAQRPWWWQQHEEMVPGGTPMLVGLFSAACAIELSRFAADTGLTGGPGNAAVQGLIQAVWHSPVAASEAVMAVLHSVPL